ncbi:FAD/NAD(P)-binding protein [Streptomyces bambusae]|uniref:FAD/NAD(P)-binding protein n=1 Tax=Streptomyces bambusae TaxID=1550616 RepID=UPI001CFE03C4|nr:FAD/NAD(P)-binding protein [Streptomyces bambusae]MCB5164144.1 FAD/NAD(P)-binding protein [Streptomyces bambusae]
MVPSAGCGVPEGSGRPAVLVVVGAGPRTTGLLERIAANAPGLWPDGRALEIHLVDPHPAGPGRIWRLDQSPLLRMNSVAENVTMFTDGSATLAGPVRPGPTLAQWAAQFAGRSPRHEPYAEPTDPDVLAELRALSGTDFASRRALGAYLDWVLRRALAELPSAVTVRTHRATATAVTGPPDGPQRVHLAGRAVPLTADLVVLSQGHLGAAPDEEHRRHGAFARRHGRFHQPPEFTSDADFAGLRPGEPVLVRGFGLAFTDLLALLTEGRGGVFRPTAGGLAYVPSGREPVLYVGSRRGVPYHAKIRYRLRGPRPPLPHHFGPAAVAALLGRGRPPDLRRDVWPSMAKEIGFGHYHELFHGHPGRTAVPWAEFLVAYDRLDWYSPGMAGLVAAAVPDPADRFDPDALDRPLEGVVCGSPEGLQEHLRGHIGRGLARREDPRFSADLGASLALHAVYDRLPELIAAGGPAAARALAAGVDGWWQGFFSFLGSGPPAFRLRQLLALSEAGIVRFVGAGMRIGTDEAAGTFTATGTSVPGHTVHATALVEAYQPGFSVARARDPLVAGLWRAGAVAAETAPEGRGAGRAGAADSGLLRVSPRRHLVDPSLGGPHPRRIALGAPTQIRGVIALARPGTDAPVLRENDTVARTVLRTLAGPGRT